MLEPQQFYVPGHSGAEAATAQRLEQLKQLKVAIQQRDASTQD